METSDHEPPSQDPESSNDLAAGAPKRGRGSRDSSRSSNEGDQKPVRKKGKFPAPQDSWTYNHLWGRFEGSRTTGSGSVPQQLVPIAKKTAADLILSRISEKGDFVLREDDSYGIEEATSNRAEAGSIALDHRLKEDDIYGFEEATSDRAEAGFIAFGVRGERLALNGFPTSDPVLIDDDAAFFRLVELEPFAKIEENVRGFPQRDDGRKRDGSSEVDDWEYNFGFDKKSEVFEVTCTEPGVAQPVKLDDIGIFDALAILKSKGSEIAFEDKGEKVGIIFAKETYANGEVGFIACDSSGKKLAMDGNLMEGRPDAIPAFLAVTELISVAKPKLERKPPVAAHEPAAPAETDADIELVRFGINELCDVNGGREVHERITKFLKLNGIAAEIASYDVDRYEDEDVVHANNASGKCVHPTFKITTKDSEIFNGLDAQKIFDQAEQKQQIKFNNALISNLDTLGDTSVNESDKNIAFENAIDSVKGNKRFADALVVSLQESENEERYNQLQNIRDILCRPPSPIAGPSGTYEAPALQPSSGVEETATQPASRLSDTLPDAAAAASRNAGRQATPLKDNIEATTLKTSVPPYKAGKYELRSSVRKERGSR